MHPTDRDGEGRLDRSSLAQHTAQAARFPQCAATIRGLPGGRAYFREQPVGDAFVGGVQ
jgi:hypothetical protein